MCLFILVVFVYFLIKCGMKTNGKQNQYRWTLLHLIIFVSYELFLKERGHNCPCEKSPSCLNIQEELTSQYLCPTSSRNYAAGLYQCTVQLVCTSVQCSCYVQFYSSVDDTVVQCSCFVQLNSVQCSCFK